MNVNSNGSSYQSTLGEVPCGTVVVVAEGRWIGETMLVAYSEEHELPLVVNMAAGDAFEIPSEQVRCTAYPGATLNVTGGRR